jgi:DNA-binding winged helix-turn-helix (wHTH) protein
MGGARAMTEADRRLTFDCYSLDLANEQLLCEGEVVALTPKAFAVLRRLVEDAGQLVTKQELLRAGWADTHVTDGVLKANILELRRALDDDAAAPRFIESVPRRGYRFVAPLTRSAAAASKAANELVGRDQLLERLEQCLERARAGERQLLFLSGEAGIGKTSVLGALVGRAAADRDVLIAPGTCMEHYGAAEAYLPVLEAIGRLLRQPGAERVLRLFRRYAPTWLAQLPWLERPSDRGASDHDLLGASKERMLREMAEVLEALPETTTLILVLEDLHWSDHSTLDLLRLLGRREESARLLIVGSYRPADVIVSGHPLRALVQELRVRRQCEDIALDLLREADVAAYLAQRFGVHTAAPALAAAVHRQTDGNPLFMVRLADELVALGVLVEEEGRWEVRGRFDAITSAVPEGLRELIDKQIARLAPEAQRALEVAGVLGNHFTAGAVAAGLGEDAVSVEERCDALARQRQLVAPAVLIALPDGTPIAQYSFTHNLYPHVLAGRVSAARRMRLHQRIGAWLEDIYGAQAAAISTQLAWHFEEGCEYQRAIHYLIMTAETAASRFAYRDSIRVLEHALALVPHLSASSRAELEIQLWQRIGDAQYCLGAMLESANAYEAAAARAAEAGLTAARVDALSGFVRPFGMIDPDRGIAAIEQAVQLSAQCGDPLLHACTEMLAAGIRLLYDAWRTKDWEICASASETIHRLSDSGPPAYHRMIYAHLQVLRGDYATALTNLETGIPKTNEPTNMMGHFFALSGKMLALLLAGRFGELMRLLRDGRDMAAKNGNEPWLFEFREAWLRTIVQDFVGARRLCEEAIRSAGEYWKDQPETIARIGAGLLDLEQRNYDAAAEKFRQVLDPEITPKFFLHWRWRITAQLGLSNMWLASGNLAAAHTETERLLEAALATADPNLQALAWEVGARVAMAEKDRSGAEDRMQRGLALVDRFEIPTVAWRVHATCSDFYRRAKDDHGAEMHRARAETVILALADSLAADEPLREAFLAADPIRRLRRASARRRVQT